jgi:Ca2+-transporting ATPase
MPNSRTSFTGLSPAQVLESRLRYGSNVLTPPKRDPWWKEYLGKFEDPVIRILMVAAAIAIAVGVAEGRIAEGVGIIIAILLATGIAYWNEHRAALEFDILNQSNDEVPFTVLRQLGYVLVARRDIVVGDLVRVEVGEEIPADGKLLEATSLQVSEARLTGESRPVEKGLGLEEKGETYPSNRLLRGATVVDGHGLFEISAVGDHTEIGKTARESIGETNDETPLNKQLANLSKVIGVVGLGMAALTFIALVFRASFVGEISLSLNQWAIAASLFFGIAISLHRIWLPVVFDGLEIAGTGIEAPAFLESEGILQWVKGIALGGFVALFCLAGIGLTVGFPSDSWLPAEAGRAFLAFFMIAVTIIVVAVPEGLAMSVTLSLAYSMRKMAAGKTLVRRMHACETIGAATVICSDKTGTLTENAMRVVEASFAGTNGKGLPKEDELRNLIIEAISANTTAHLSHTSGEKSVLGNPTEGALLLWLDSLGFDYVEFRAGFKTEQQTTFNTERKTMSTSGFSIPLARPVSYCKGAPEIILAECDSEWSTGPVGLKENRRQEIESHLRTYQARGMRTLGFAIDGKIWLGFVAIADPVRAEVPEAIAACRRAGVEVKIVTGDNPETAGEVGRIIGLGSSVPVTGTDFAKATDTEASNLGFNLSILARARPKDKMRLVMLLKERGHVVAVTGDGVNDGPALNHADVGLSMGKTGSAVAKEASDIVLLDDSFNSIVNAIRWGRSLYANIQRFILFQLTINVAALIIALIGPFIDVALPLTVMQMLWINLIMDTFAALALATEPPDDGVMGRPPRPVDAFIVTRKMGINLFSTAFSFVIILVCVLLFFKNRGELLSDGASRGGTIFFTLFVLLQFWNLFNARCFGRSQSAFQGLGANPSFLTIAVAIIGGQILIVQFGGEAFRTVPLNLIDWIFLLGVSSIVLLVGETIRFFQKRHQNDFL